MSMKSNTCGGIRVHGENRVAIPRGGMLHQIWNFVAARSFPGHRMAPYHTIWNFSANPRRRAGTVRHIEERFRIADELVHVSLAGDFLHYTLLVVVSQ